MKPALTAEEWEERLAMVDVDSEDGKFSFAVYVPEDSTAKLERVFIRSRKQWFLDVAFGQRLRLAAYCLFGQPFGFTRDDVRLLWSHDLDELADRIEALLPPEGK